jgi:hypothetical protein
MASRHEPLAAGAMATVLVLLMLCFVNGPCRSKVVETLRSLLATLLSFLESSL